MFVMYCIDGLLRWCAPCWLLSDSCMRDFSDAIFDVCYVPVCCVYLRALACYVMHAVVSGCRCCVVICGVCWCIMLRCIAMSCASLLYYNM